jgi:UDP-N-acetylglucosamine--N-acetylmuramyl-(pentapeptide) pyrophosphoryl-undecaprenol N-acetylglucosamine transferase
MNAEWGMENAACRRHGGRRSSPLRVALAGGGTGGHLYPGIAVARCLQARCPGVDIAFVGLRGGLDERVVPREGFRLYTVPVRALKGRSRLAQVRALGTLLVGTWQAVRLLQRLHPHLVIGAGGYVMGPAVLAATLLRLPRVIMEQNLIPGLTVRVLARCAHRVFTTFPETQAYLPAGWVEFTGTPIRPELWASGLTEAVRCNGVLHVLVFGGSQGAHRINQAMLEALPFLQEHKQQLRIVHQTGDADFATMVQAYQQAALDVEVSPFLHDMGSRYRWAHLVVCRAGASTLAELTACGKPSILVPYPYAADDHQRYNALALQQQGAAQVILDAELTGARLAEALQGVLAHPLRLRQQAERSRALGKPQAADAIVTACLRLLDLT